MNAARKKIENDWRRERIKYELALAGWTFAKIAREYGYAPNGPNMVMWKPWPVMEQIVADLIGVHPSDIWPSRYDKRRQPLQGDMKSFSRLRAKPEHSENNRGEHG